MKTLLQINTNVGWNATGRIAEDVGRTAINNGWLSTIAYGRKVNGAPASSSRLIRIGTDIDIACHGVSTRLFDNHGRASLHATRNFIKRIEEISPDVIHLHNVHGYYLNYPELFAYLKRTGIPVVWTLHDCWSFTGHCAYSKLGECVKWRTGCEKCPLKGKYPASILMDRSYKNYLNKKEAFTSLDNLHIVAVSEWMGRMVSQSFLGHYPLTVIHNGIGVPDNIAEKESTEKIVLGVASKWDDIKGLKTFITLRSRLPKDYRIVVIGLSPSQIRSLPAGITGLPRINERNQLYDWYAKAAVYVNPSYFESFSLSNIEAQACGTPVVCYDNGGMPETVSEHTGVVVRSGNIKVLINAIRYVAESRDEFTASDCREHIRASFNKDKIYSAYINLYDDILGVRKSEKVKR